MRTRCPHRIALACWTVVGLCGFAGCQKLPPGVLAGSPRVEPVERRPSPPLAEFATSEAMAAVSKVTPDPASDGKSSLDDRVARLERALAASNSERDRLREKLTAALERAVDTQTELVEVYRDRAATAEEESRRLRIAGDVPTPE